MVLPVSSITSRNVCAGALFFVAAPSCACPGFAAAAEIGEEVCAHVLGPAAITASNAASDIATMSRGPKLLVCRNSLSSLATISLKQKKCPARNRGTSPPLFLAKSDAASAASEGSLAYGFSADYSGGTAADFHGLPRCPCLQIENRVYVEPPSVSTRRQSRRQIHRFLLEISPSDSSNLACAFPPQRAILPENPPAGTIHSEKYSWNFSNRLSTTAPFHQGSLFWPSSAPAPNGC